MNRTCGFAALLAAGLLSACGGGGGGASGPPRPPSTYTVGGVIRNLPVGTSVVLEDNGGDSLTVSSSSSSSTPFTFATALSSGAAYSVTIVTQPTGQNCVVGSGTGTVGAASITSVSVNCTPNKYTVGGIIANMIFGTSIVLEDDGGDSLTAPASSTSSTPFTFATALSSGTAYSISIAAQPLGQTCVVGSGTGAIASANVTNAFVDCTPNKYTVGGTISGLNQKLVLGDGIGDQLTLAAGATSFLFTPGIGSAGIYAVSVDNPLSGQTCTVMNASGTIVASNVSNVAVTCVTTGIGIGGTVSGLTGTNSVVLQDNGADNLQVFANGGFLFLTALQTGAAYDVTVLTQPPNQTCAVTNGSGTTGATIVGNVAVNCTTNTYSVGGSVAGLPSGETLILTNNEADALTITASGAFTFATPVASGASYAVFTQTVPAGMTCGVMNGLGTIVISNITNILVQCEPNAGSTTYTVGGAISGLNAGGLVLLDAGFDTLTVAANSTSFTFGTGLITGTPYGVAVQTQPTGETCTVTSGSGTIASANVSNVSVACVAGTAGGSAVGRKSIALAAPAVNVAPTARFSSGKGDAAGLVALLQPGANALVAAQTFDGAAIAGLPLIGLFGPLSANQPDSMTLDCSQGGSASREISLANPDKGVHAGDSVAMAFDRCSSGSGTTIHGKVSVRMESDASADRYALDVTGDDLSVTRDGIVLGPYRMRGSISQLQGVEAARFAIDKSTVEEAPIVAIHGSLAAIRSGSVDVTLGFGIARIRYAHWGYDVMTGIPSTGTAEITGANGYRATVTVTSGGYAVMVTVGAVTKRHSLPF
jgi:hypothetical protein